MINHKFSDPPRSIKVTDDLVYRSGTNMKGAYVVELPIACSGGTPRNPTGCKKLGYKIGKASGSQGLKTRFKSYDLAYDGLVKVRHIKTFPKEGQAQQYENKLKGELKGKAGRGRSSEYFNRESDISKALNKIQNFRPTDPPVGKTRNAVAGNRQASLDLRKNMKQSKTWAFTEGMRWDD